MLENYCREGTDVDGIFFTEGEIAAAQLIGDVKISSDRQNISLDKLKNDLAAMAEVKSGNALDKFEYVQKDSAFSFSRTRWVVTSRIVQVSE
jgi:hypothetical protein